MPTSPAQAILSVLSTLTNTPPVAGSVGQPVLYTMGLYPPNRPPYIPDQTPAMNCIKATSPLDGKPLGEYTPPHPDSLQHTLHRLRERQQAWAALPVAARAECLEQLRRAIVRGLDGLVERLCQITGKVATEALLGKR